MIDKTAIKEATKIITRSKHVIAFTGAGISVESGIPPFRGERGLWNKYDPKFLDISYFNTNPLESWEVLKEIFYDFFDSSEPNAAHLGLAELEKKGYLKSIITQNIDNLHIDADSKTVYEFHGNSKKLVCLKEGIKYLVSEFNLQNIPPKCPRCGDVLKPDIIFFGEGIPTEAYEKSFREIEKCDVVIIIGSTGEVFPAASLPKLAKQTGAFIIEINPEKSNFTEAISDLFLQGKASEVISDIIAEISS